MSTKQSPSTLPLNQIIEGDCREILKSIPKRSVDLIFADPPYNMQLPQPLFRPDNTSVDAVNDEWDKFQSFKEYDTFTRDWLSQCRECLKDNGSIWVIGSYHCIFRIGAIMQDLGFWIMNDVVWIKNNPMPNMNGTRFCNAHETMIWATRSEANAGYTFNYRSLKVGNEDLQMRSDWYMPICSGAERLTKNGSKLHSTQKPEALLHRIIMACSKPGDVVLDPFFGSGTTGAVAAKLSRNWIGIEKERDYIGYASTRISSITPHEKVDESLLGLNATPEIKIPFITLIENGLLKSGERLRLNNSDIFATIQEDGSLLSDSFQGSIHRTGAHLLGTPSCNGWVHWYYKDEASNSYQLIDILRKRMRAMMADSLHNTDQ